MFRYDPTETTTAITAPVVALIAADDEEGTRAKALSVASSARAGVGRGRIRAASYPHDGHNLMRYRPEAVSAAILSVAGEADA